MNVDGTKALVPHQGIVHPLAPIENRGMSPYFEDDEPPGARLRFLGYGRAGRGNVYGSRGRVLSGPEMNGGTVDLYV